MSVKAHYDVPEADVRPRDHSASVHPEPRDTLLRDKCLVQYAVKERHENAKGEPGSQGQFDDADPAETGVQFSSQVGILRGAGHGWVIIQKWRSDLATGPIGLKRLENIRTQPQQRVYGRFADPSRQHC